MGEKKLREPIISILGHVDHGKTTLLDWIRGSVIATKEAGGITQHIGATDVPYEVIERICGSLFDQMKAKTEIRGLLFIDTPGHEAFTNLRKRGGSVADLTILVVDINDGVMPQTKEALDILKEHKVPFIIAANKIDAISGYKPGQPMKKQQEHVQKEFYDRFYELVGQLGKENINAKLYSNIDDFTKEIAIVPISAEEGDGIPELLMMLIGLAQQYLKGKLRIDENEPGKGSILEVKKEKGMGTTIDVIIYDGVLRHTDQIVVGAKEPVVTRIKALLKPNSMTQMRDSGDKFKAVEEVTAAAGVKISAPDLDDAMAGAPVYVGGEELIPKVKDEIEDIEIHSDKLGVIIKADTIGSMEALVSTLNKEGIPIKRGTVGKVSNADVMEASAVRKENKYRGVILAFNSEVLENSKMLANDNNVKVFESGVIYQLIDDYEKWVREEKQKERKLKEKRITTPMKARLMPQCVFRQSKPAIVGIEVLAGKLRKKTRIMREDGKVVGRIKDIQHENESIDAAEAGQEVAVSIEGPTIGRQLEEGDLIYSFLPSEEVKEIDAETLTEEEKEILSEIKEVKRQR